jgi:hypothetical protein
VRGATRRAAFFGDLDDVVAKIIASRVTAQDMAEAARIRRSTI